MIEDSKIRSTIEREGLAIVWDAVIIGSGPAGALVACHLAEPAKKILLIDRAHFPRAKVCGCCLNGAAEEALKRAGLGAIFSDSNAVPLTKLQLRDGANLSSVNLPAGFALSRNFMDAYLIEQAIMRGAHFAAGLSAKVSSEQRDAFAQVDLSASDFTATIKTKLVIVADGLGGHALSSWKDFSTSVEKNARFGCGTILGGDDQFQRGSIYMCCHHSGYAGLVVLEDGRIDVAAALDRDFSRRLGGPAQAVAAILDSCRLARPAGLTESHWHGTDSLTQKRNSVAAGRIFVVGDSCGYAEPFTGEGMAWAFQSAESVVPFAKEAMANWQDSLIEGWQNEHRRLLTARQKRSKLIAYTLRSDFLRRMAFPLISSFPVLADKVIANISQSASGNVAWQR